MSVQCLEHAPRSVRTERVDTNAAATQDMSGIPWTKHAEPLVGCCSTSVSVLFQTGIHSYIFNLA